MPPIRDFLWLTALTIMGLVWWVDHSRLATLVRSHEYAHAVQDREIEQWKMEVERLRGQTKSQRSDEQNKQELEKLQGEWVLHSHEFKGRQAPTSPHVSYQIKGSEITTDGPADASSRVGFTIDASKNPKQFDRMTVQGDNLLGIYKLEGDTGTVCSGTSLERPGEFKTTTLGWRILVWKRAPKEE